MFRDDAPPSATPPEEPAAPLPSSATRRLRLAWMIGSILAVIALIVALLRPAGPGHAVAAATAPSPPGASSHPEVVSAGLLRIPPDSPLLKRLEIVTLAPETTRQPTAVVSGVVVARVKAGTQPIEDRWQFSSSTLSGLYADLQRSRNEVNFATQQLAKTRDLVAAETDFLTATVERLSGLAETANIPQKEFLAAKSALLKAQLQGEKDVYTAESDVRAARRNQTAIERSIAQAGVEPDMLGHAEEHMAVVSADLPELKIGMVRQGLECAMRFYGLPDRTFVGHVEQIGSTVTPDRRTLRVFLHIADTAGDLKPGMFGEVSIGTDERRAIRLLETSVLHIDLQDFVLVAAGGDTWRATPVRIGEGRDGTCTVLEGLAAGDRVIGGGSILLKGLLAQSFLKSAAREPDGRPTAAPVAGDAAP